MKHSSTRGGGGEWTRGGILWGDGVQTALFYIFRNKPAIEPTSWLQRLFYNKLNYVAMENTTISDSKFRLYRELKMFFVSPI